MSGLFGLTLVASLTEWSLRTATAHSPGMGTRDSPPAYLAAEELVPLKVVTISILGTGSPKFRSQYMEYSPAESDSEPKAERLGAKELLRLLLNKF